MAKILPDKRRSIITQTCERCTYVWIPRKDNIKQCPRCKSLSWNKERKPKNDK